MAVFTTLGRADNIHNFQKCGVKDEMSVLWTEDVDNCITFLYLCEGVLTILMNQSIELKDASKAAQINHQIQWI